jgi:hypothetical protein
MTRIEAGFEQMFNQFAKGDRYARRDVMAYAEKAGIDLLSPHREALEQALLPNQEAILDAFIARRTATAEIAAAEPVLASTELRDDDVEETDAESAPTLLPPPKPKREIPDPTPEPGKKYPKPFTQMTPLQRKIYYPEW